ncbi:MAG: cysteine desulfurase NifS [Chloroflexota bacterium]|nr:cysteine desulfurase NifS [Chloroflexota bacterium]
MKRVYLDHAATTPTDPRVVEAMLPFFTESFGNPSSIHSLGQESKEAMEDARTTVAGLIGARSEEIVFTSGGTEADNYALKGIAYAKESVGNHIITTTVEHHAIMETCQFLEKHGFQVTTVPVDKYGVVDPIEIEKAITDKTILISVMLANNEIGTIEPIAEIARIAKEREICIHTDAVQAIGHIPVDVNELNVDLLSLSAHKLYGPKGIGALYVRKGIKLANLLHGGGQERGRRGSTENVAGIVGLGKAVEIAKDAISEDMKHSINLRDELTQGLIERIDDIHLNGHPTHRLPNNVNLSIHYVEGESMLLNLDLEGIAASTGSACSSGNLEPSHVLLALGLSHEQAHGSLRFTLGRDTEKDDVMRVLNTLPSIVSKLRAMSPLAKAKS